MQPGHLEVLGFVPRDRRAAAIAQSLIGTCPTLQIPSSTGTLEANGYRIG